MDEVESELLAQSRRCARLRQRLQEAALRQAPMEVLRRHAEGLGLPVKAELAQIAEAELAFACDLALYTAAQGRPRAIERQLRQLRQRDADSALLLSALAHAWFSVFRVVDRHPEAGLILEDALLGGEIWALDEVLEEDGVPGAILATRLGRLRGFAMTTGVVATLDEAMLAALRQVIADSGLPPAEMAADARFAALIYRRHLGL